MSGFRVGADVGGTFTDIVLEHPDGSLASTKVLTTHGGPEQGILEGIGSLVAEQGVEWNQLTQVLHGTTLATNALIERRGARTAFVTTQGFRDVIETRTEGRFEQYDLNIVLPTPLIERRDRYVVAERIGAQAQTLLAYDSDQADSVIQAIASGNYDSVAVGFMHSYVNDDHERRFRDQLVAKLPGIAVSISSEVSPQMREFERFNTVCANAYVQPLMATYLMRLRDELEARGANCPLYLIHSGGGLMSVESAARFPVRLVESGPAGGAIFAADLATRYGTDRVVSFDMGGTTAKIALIENSSPRTAKTFEVARTTRFKKGSGMPISIPVIEMIEIGAGGGSIAGVDELGQIRIGPRSAGSEPGPAAYGLGGTEPTVTDANLQLGRLHADTFGAKNISLDPGAASTAIDSGVGEPLGMDTNTAALGVAEVVDENMTNAARVHAVENGTDLTGFSMIAFGGGAPLHAARLMDKLNLAAVWVPPGAGVGSAIGFLRAPFSYEAVRSFYSSTTDFDFEGANRVLADLRQEAEGFVRQGTDAAVETEQRVSMRYAGQGWEIPVELELGVFDEFASEQLAATFTKSYETFFGRAIDDVEIEAVSWSVRVSSTVERANAIEVVLPSAVDDSADSRPDYKMRPMYDPSKGEWSDASIIERSTLDPGSQVTGPALIVESQTTTVLGAAHCCVVQPDRSLRIVRKAEL